MLGSPWFLTMPLLIYVALFHTDRLLGFIAGTYGILVSDLRIVLGLCAWFSLSLVLGIYSYLSGLRAWKKFQKHPVASIDENELPPDDWRVELPPPTPTPPSSVILRGYRSVVGFILAELALLFASYAMYFLWSNTLFRWPPNPNLQAYTMGTALALFLVGSGLIWRLGARFA